MARANQLGRRRLAIIAVGGAAILVVALTTILVQQSSMVEGTISRVANPDGSRFQDIPSVSDDIIAKYPEIYDAKLRIDQQYEALADGSIPSSNPNTTFKISRDKASAFISELQEQEVSFDSPLGTNLAATVIQVQGATYSLSIKI